MCYGWKVRLELAQEESPTGQSCNPWIEPFGFRVGLKVDGYAVARTVGNGFPKPSKSLDIAKDAGAADDGANRDVFPWKIRETAPDTGNVLREDEPVLNIERGLNSKISLRAVH